MGIDALHAAETTVLGDRLEAQPTAS